MRSWLGIGLARSYQTSCSFGKSVGRTIYDKRQVQAMDWKLWSHMKTPDGYIWGTADSVEDIYSPAR